MRDSFFIQGSGLVAQDYFCYNIGEDLSDFVGTAIRNKLTEVFGEQDGAAFAKACDRVLAGESECEELDASIICADGARHNLRIVLEPAEDNLCLMTVIDIEHAISACTSHLEELREFRMLSEKVSKILFEYSYKSGTIELFRYMNNMREPLEPADQLNKLKPMIISELNNKTDGVQFNFMKVFDLDGSDYYVRGVALTQNSKMYKMFGSVSARKEDIAGTLHSPDTHDAVTGLYNKPYALDLARKAVESGEHKKVSLLMIDIDDFKTINDSFSHLFGDEVIKRLAIILRDAAYGRGFAARFGGDEFFVCLYDVEDEDSLRGILSNIAYHYSTSFPNKKHSFTLSQGIAEYPRNGSNFDILLKKADRALYKAKFKGKRRFIIYKEEIHGELTENEDENSLITAEDSMVREKQTLFCEKVFPEMIGIARTFNGNTKCLDKPLTDFMNTFSIDGISFYTGPELTCRYRWGHYTNPMDNVYYVTDRDVQFCFLPSLVFSGQVKNIKRHYMDNFHGNIIAHGLEYSMHVIIGSFEDIRGVVTFDREKYLGSNSVFEIQHLTMFGRMLGELLL